MRWTALAVAGVALAAHAQPNLVLIRSPRGMVEVSGGAIPSDSFTLANVGTSAASVTLQPSQNFFTVTPSSVAIPAGGNQIITIRGSLQPVGVYDGAASIAGSGVPQSGIAVNVRMMVGVPPAGTVDPQPSAFIVPVVGPPDQVHQSGIAFRNNGNATMQGLVVGDAAWIAPQQPLVTIQAGRNAEATFAVDPSKRPDAAAPLGGLTGTLSLRYLGGNASANSVTVSIVDVVKPGVSPGEPAPLAAGELALFVPALSSRNQVFSDLFLSARSGQTAVTDLKLFYAQSLSGSSSLTAAIAQPSSGLGLWFPSIVLNVFGKGEQVGTVQFRGGQTTNVSIAAVQISTSGEGRIFSSALPILRSDRGVGAGESVLLAGVEKSSTVSTNVYLQEMSGSAATAQTEFFDSNGVSIGMKRTDSISPFRAVELLDAVPAGARSLRVTNMSASARIAATALVSDNATQASWPVIDPRSVSATTTWLVPIVSPPSGNAQTDLFVTNGSTGPTNVTIESFAPGFASRRRAVRSMGAPATSPAAPPAAGPAAFQPPNRRRAANASTLRPLETLRTSVTSTNTMLRVSASAGTISATGRITITVPGRIGSFGTSLPVVPISSALSASQGTRFSGVDDTSLLSRSSLILAEVTGGSATVRLTLRYVFVAGLAVSAQARSTKNFSVAPGQMLVISDLARSVIGPQRDSFGDLRNMQVDVEVIEGSGRILPFLESIDNSSGDLMVRAE
jgi:hypothetical protein